MLLTARQFEWCLELTEGREMETDSIQQVYIRHVPL